MATSSLLATLLDEEMLRAHGTAIYPASTPLSAMTPVSNVVEQVCGRYLIRYLMRARLGMLLGGTTDRQYVTPTPYAPEELASWLALPNPRVRRAYVLLLDPSRLNDVYGPRYVRLGRGIEYILNSGFTADAIVDVSPDGISRWELELR